MRKKNCRGPGREKTTFLYTKVEEDALFARSFATLSGLRVGKEKKERKKRRKGKRATIKKPDSTICTSSRQVPIDRESDGENWCLSHGGSQRHGRYPVLGTLCKGYRREGLRTLCAGPCRTTSPSGRAGQMTGCEP